MRDFVSSYILYDIVWHGKDLPLVDKISSDKIYVTNPNFHPFCTICAGLLHYDIEQIVNIVRRTKIK